MIISGHARTCFAPKKKISKRELKEDALITTYVKVTSLYEENKRTISIAVAVLALAVWR